MSYVILFKCHLNLFANPEMYIWLHVVICIQRFITCSLLILDADWSIGVRRVAVHTIKVDLTSNPGISIPPPSLLLKSISHHRFALKSIPPLSLAITFDQMEEPFNEQGDKYITRC